MTPTSTATRDPSLPEAPVPLPETVIEARTGWRALGLGELWHFRDLLGFLVWRDVKVRYAQSVLGVGWALLQPLFSVLVFSVVFGRMAGVSAGEAPYSLFSMAVVVPWTFFSNALAEATQSLVGNAGLLAKVYFPRLFLPLSAALGKVIDFALALAFTLVVLGFAGYAPTVRWLALPVLTVLILLAATGLGLWFSALALHYRDVRYAMNFALQLFMFASPVVYPMALVPEHWRLLYALNPMAGILDAFCACLLGGPWTGPATLAVSVASAAAIFAGGAFYFKRAEAAFADVA